MKIGQLADAVHLDIQTIRYYEQQGLIRPPLRLANGYRDYAKDSIQHIQFIKKAKLVGFTLSEIKQLLEIRVTADEHTCEEVKNYTGQKLSEIEEKILKLEQIKTALKKIHQSCCGGNEAAVHCSILSALEGEG